MGIKGMTHDQHTRPSARKDDLSITSVSDETVIYDQLTHRASCLNAVTAAVWGACDGKNDVSALLDAVRQAGFQDASEDIVWMALDQLYQAELLEPFDITNTKIKNPDRREMLRTLGKRAAAVIPVVSTINIQPAIANHSGCTPLWGSCNSNDDCCSHRCVRFGRRGWCTFR